MQKLSDGTIVISASDLSAAAACEWAVMRSLDKKLGRDVEVPNIADAMLERTGKLGDVHELQVLAELEETLGTAVTIERPTYGQAGVEQWREVMAEATQATLDALASGAPLVFQGAFFDGEFQGFADFLVRSAGASNGDGASDESGRPCYEVYDTKLARSAKIPALLQLAAYVDQLRKAGIDASDTVTLILGDKSRSVHDVRDILPVYLHRRERLLELIAGRVADSEPTPWNDPRYSACGRCPVCAVQVTQSRDLLMVAGLMLGQREKFRAAGITTIDELAAARSTAPGVPSRTFARVQAQARIQLATLENPDAPPAFAVFDAPKLAAIPAPSPGDLFFDFEGDPLYEEKGRWGLDYLFGVYGDSVNPGSDDPNFLTFWAEDLAEERTALLEFMAFVAERRAQHPNLHIYHYASYEKTHLLSIAARHGVCEDEVDDLLRDQVLVDLYPIVRRSVTVGSHSYSIKKLEPLYMGDEHREGTASAIDSVQQFADYCTERAAGDDAAATALKTDIVQYNRYDCYSTVKLRDWLVALAAENSVAPTSTGSEADDTLLPRVVQEPDETYLGLMALIADTPVELRTPLQTGIALAAAAIDYHRREDKKFWQEHFSRLTDDIEGWAATRGVITLDAGEATVIEDWHVTGRAQPARILELAGTVAPGSRFSLSDTPYLVYDEPYPPVEASPPQSDPFMRLAHNRTEILEVSDDGTVLIKERLGRGGMQHDELPVALTPPGPLNVKNLKAAIREWGERLLATYRVNGVLDTHAVFADPSFDILMKSPPRGTLHHSDELKDSIVESLLGLDRSYIAVQGPPGSGKTFTGSHVIARLVSDYGWKVGVVAQSHKTVENVLNAVVARGVPADAVGKRAKKGEENETQPWTVVPDAGVDSFVNEQGGLVFGGTAWDFTNRTRIPEGHFDLLVIDEAGQYSLANTVAVSTAAQRLLLLGDPQQLPQVTVGAHPEPINESALGWLSQGHDVLPAELGYFLAVSWRMHPAVCEPVSQLSYAGELHSKSGPDAPVRELSGVEPGLYALPVRHAGNSTESPEEADAVVRLVQKLLGTPWTDGSHTAPLDEHGFIVVAAYNAQVGLIRARLDDAGLPNVPVGTVDKFQGHEAPVAIVSLAASSSADVPRGLEFLIMPNRLNVAISRAKWAAYLVHSPALADHLPTNVESLGLLGKFLRLLGGAKAAH